LPFMTKNLCGDRSSSEIWNDWDPTGATR
jgi:hypothetical protein